MKFDSFGLIITNEPAPGCYGDSCAESARYQLAAMIAYNTGYRSFDFHYFITSVGILRHPLSPWHEDDTSEDQKLPLFLALDVTDPSLATLYKAQDKWWRLKTFTGLRVLTQALLFQLPIRWDDGTMSFQWSSKSSCDYLNFAAQVFYAHLKNEKNILVRLAMKLIPQSKIKVKVLSYYMNDPTNANLIHIYFSAIEKVWPS